MGCEEQQGCRLWGCTKNMMVYPSRPFIYFTCQHTGALQAASWSLIVGTKRPIQHILNHRLQSVQKAPVQYKQPGAQSR